MEYKSLQDDGLEGFRVKLVNDESLFEWEVAIFGPPDTLYQGGYFKVRAPRRTKDLPHLPAPRLRGQTKEASALVFDFAFVHTHNQNWGFRGF